MYIIIIIIIRPMVDGHKAVVKSIKYTELTYELVRVQNAQRQRGGRVSSFHLAGRWSTLPLWMTTLSGNQRSICYDDTGQK